MHYVLYTAPNSIVCAPILQTIQYCMNALNLSERLLLAADRGKMEQVASGILQVNYALRTT
jgi:hypothetical protein